MNVGFTPQAYDDLRAIRDWIAEDDARAADRVLSRIVQTAMMFGQFPLLGRAGRVEGTREFSVAGLPYLIVYAIASESEIDVLTVVHTRQRYPRRIVMRALGERHRLLGYGPQGFALEVSPWQTRESIDAAMLYRGVIVAGWAAVETDLIELAIRASRHPSYLGARNAFPTKLSSRISYLQQIADAPGPLKPFQSLIDAVLRRYVASSALRNRMAHAKMRVQRNWGATLSGYSAKTGNQITHYEDRYTEEDLRRLALRAARFARAVNRLMARLQALQIIPTVEETRTP